MRIIGGEFRSRPLLPPAGQTTRPIPDRAKVALFNTLAPWFQGRPAVADLFCGTGSMGLEALSRGAAHCWFAERDPGALERLEQNIGALRVRDRATLWRGDISQELARWLAALPRPLDVVFLDPPYALARQWFQDALADGVMAALGAALADDGIVMFRTPEDLPVPERVGPLELARRRAYGTTALNYLQKPGAGEASPPGAAAEST